MTREDIGVTPRTVQVRQGAPRMFVLRLPGYREARVVIQYGDPNPVRVKLQPEPMAPVEGTDPTRGSMGPSVKPPPTMRTVVRIVRVMQPDPMRAAPRPMQRVTDQGIVDPFRK